MCESSNIGVHGSPCEAVAAETELLTPQPRRASRRFRNLVQPAIDADVNFSGSGAPGGLTPVPPHHPRGQRAPPEQFLQSSVPDHDRSSHLTDHQADDALAFEAHAATAVIPSAFLTPLSPTIEPRRDDLQIDAHASEDSRSAEDQLAAPRRRRQSELRLCLLSLSVESDSFTPPRELRAQSFADTPQVDGITPATPPRAQSARSISAPDSPLTISRVQSAVGTSGSSSSHSSRIERPFLGLHASLGRTQTPVATVDSDDSLAALLSQVPTNRRRGSVSPASPAELPFLSPAATTATRVLVNSKNYHYRSKQIAGPSVAALRFERLSDLMSLNTPRMNGRPLGMIAAVKHNVPPTSTDSSSLTDADLRRSH
jgi:hypothetical protein